MLASTGAATADMVIPAVAAPDCVNIEKAFTQQGITDPKKIVAAPLCLNGQVAAGLGGDFPKWTYLIASSLFGDTTDPGMIEYMKLAQTSSTLANAPNRGHCRLRPADDHRQDTQPGRLRPPVPERDPVGRAGVQGPAGPRRPALECGYNPAAPGVCNNRSQFFEYEGKNKWVKTAGWLQPLTSS